MRALSLIGLLLAGTGVISWGVLATVPPPHNLMLIVPVLALYFVFFRAWVVRKNPPRKNG